MSPDCCLVLLGFSCDCPVYEASKIDQEILLCYASSTHLFHNCNLLKADVKDNPTILLIEDDRRLAALTKEFLEQQEMSVLLEHQGDNALDRIMAEKPDLVILDLSLPGKDGLDICRETRAVSNIPILILTARENQTDEVLGLELGADDYVTKPVEPRVLFARIRALLRRYRSAFKEKPVMSAGDEPVVLHFGGLTIDNSSYKVILFEKEIKLTTADFEVLWVLASRAGDTVTREEVFEITRGISYDGFDRSIDVRVSRLRKKLNDHPTDPQRIKTIWGKGYLFVKNGWTS